MEKVNLVMRQAAKRDTRRMRDLACLPPLEICRCFFGLPSVWVYAVHILSIGWLYGVYILSSLFIRIRCVGVLGNSASGTAHACAATKTRVKLGKSVEEKAIWPTHQWESAKSVYVYEIPAQNQVWVAKIQKG